MSKSAKILLLIASALVAIGGIIFVCALALGGFSENKYQTDIHGITEPFESVSVNTNTADITLIPSNDGACSVECFEQEGLKHTVRVEDGTLYIELRDTRKWYEHISFITRDTEIKVYLPRGEYGRLTVENDTGDVDIPDTFKFGSVDISVSTGDVKCLSSASEKIKISSSTGDITLKFATAGAIELETSTGTLTVGQVKCDGAMSVTVSTGDAYLDGVSCGSLISEGDTGDLTMKSVTVSGRLDCERSTGDIKLDMCDAAEISIETDTGDVTGSLLSEKVFVVETDTGKKDVPKSASGGLCEITTDTGDIRITVKS